MGLIVGETYRFSCNSGFIDLKIIAVDGDEVTFERPNGEQIARKFEVFDRLRVKKIS